MRVGVGSDGESPAAEHFGMELRSAAILLFEGVKSSEVK